LPITQGRIEYSNHPSHVTTPLQIGPQSASLQAAQRVGISPMLPGCQGWSLLHASSPVALSKATGARHFLNARVARARRPVLAPRVSSFSAARKTKKPSPHTQGRRLIALRGTTLIQ